MPFFKKNNIKKNTGVFGYRLVELVYLSDVGAIAQLTPKQRRQGALAVTLIYGVLIIMAFPMTEVSFYPEFHWFINAMMVSVIATTVMAINSIILFPKKYWLHVATSVLTIGVSFFFGMYLGFRIEDIMGEEGRFLLPGGLIYFVSYMVSVMMVQIGLRYMNQLTQNISRENARKDDELRLGNELQSKLLAPIFLKRDNLAVFASGTLASEVGGDFFDVWENDDSVRIFLGDVSGHGVAAGLMVSSLKAIIDYGNRRHESVEQILAEMNTFIRKNGHKGMFSTCAVLEVDSSKKSMKVWNAGHPAISLFDDTSGEMSLRPPGFALGMVEKFEINSLKTPISSHSRIVAFTDGFVESMNKKREEFGKEKVLDIVRNRSHSPEKVFEELNEEISKFTKGTAVQDDSTLVVVDVF